MSIDAFWQMFLRETGRPPQTSYMDCFHFEATESGSAELLALVPSGRKRATASSLYSFADGCAPKAGDLCIVTDWDGEPRCVIETTDVTILPFDEMTEELCASEGEGDTLETWRASHERFFRQEGAQLGYAFGGDMPVVPERFRVAYRR